ncbi:MAG: lamin tail domain-containing protein, partial [Candidatus Eisenbacteria bacterium]|nr:lamin tail domain-containing protein [Candidatus Eisenbacteria bacterium]
LVDPYGNDYAGAEAAVHASGVCEISVPWSALGFSFVPADPIRVSVASFLSNASDEILPAGDGNAWRAADVVTQYALAGSGRTLTELADGVVDHALDAYFDGRGACIAPIVVNEEFFEGGVNSQWLEIVNVSQSVLPLSQFKIGDAETPGSNEGMARFPSGVLLEPGAAFVVAYRGATFLSENGMRAGAECTSSDGGTPDMVPFTGWASNVAFNIPNSGDAVLVLDRANTVVDVVTYKNASYPGVRARPAVAALHSLERSSPNADTDDCATDFADRVTPTPAQVMQFTGVGDAALGGTRWAGAYPMPSVGHVHLALQLGEALPAGRRVELLDVTGRRVREIALPAHDMGRMTVEWDGRDSGGRAVAAGVYFAHVRVSGRSLVQRLVIAR